MSAMSVFGNIFIGLILVGLGFLMLKYNQAIAGTLGTPTFLGRYFGPGREYSFYKLVAILLMILGGFFIFGLFGIIANFIFSPFRNLLK
jgi:small-conductance mechanosensitive channel